MAIVIGFIHGEEGAFGLSFPDFPGFAGGGETIEDAIRRGREGLLFHIESMQENGEEIPRIRSADEVLTDPAAKEDFGDAVALCPLEIELRSKQIRVNLSLDENLVARVDRAAEQSGETRSGYFAQAVKGRLASASQVAAPRTMYDSDLPEFLRPRVSAATSVFGRTSSTDAFKNKDFWPTITTSNLSDDRYQLDLAAHILSLIASAPEQSSEAYRRVLKLINEISANRVADSNVRMTD